MDNEIRKEREQFVEIGSALEHKRWADWQAYLHSLCIKNEDGSLTIPKERVERWERQIKTSYEELPEEEKEFDRIEVRKYIPFLEHTFKLAESYLKMAGKMPQVKDERNSSYSVKEIGAYNQARRDCILAFMGEAAQAIHNAIIGEVK